MNRHDIKTLCRVCGGHAWIEEHMPCSDESDLVFYYICCECCGYETHASGSIEMGKEGWDRMNCPDGCLLIGGEE